MGNLPGEGPLQRVLDLLFPPRCVACRRAGAVLCESCLSTIKPILPPVCAHCGRSLAGTTTTSAPDTPLLCAGCRVNHDLAPLASVRVAASYEGPTRSAIRALKYGGQRRVATPLGRLLAGAYHAAGWQADLIVPLPLHAKRTATRGYNQSLLLARALSAEVGAPVADGLLERWRETPPQVGLHAADRRANVAGAFRLRTSDGTNNPAATLAGKRIVLLDDVTTTGSTLAAAAQSLASASPAVLWGLAVARPALGHDN